MSSHLAQRNFPSVFPLESETATFKHKVKNRQCPPTTVLMTPQPLHVHSSCRGGTPPTDGRAVMGGLGSSEAPGERLWWAFSLYLAFTIDVLVVDLISHLNINELEH
jgi:hypothetical protein